MSPAALGPRLLAAVGAALALGCGAEDLLRVGQDQALLEDNGHYHGGRRSHHGHGHSHVSRSIVHGFRHRLRICNAYPYASAMDVYVRGSEKLTGDSPMPYPSCVDFTAAMQAGDKIDFKVGDASAGTFSVSDLPNNDAILLLVLYRHDTLTTAVKFQSHVFANLLNAQVAIIDAYKGTLHAMPRIVDMQTEAPHGSHDHASEELRFDSVVAVNPGIYEVELHGQGGAESRAAIRAPLVALNRESYVVLRTGVEAQQGPSFPEELFVYPRSDPARLAHSAAAGASPASVWCLLLSAAAAAVAAGAGR